MTYLYIFYGFKQLLVHISDKADIGKAVIPVESTAKVIASYVWKTLD